jgi:RNA polymerase sigma factor (sigma-70 family)
MIRAQTRSYTEKMRMQRVISQVDSHPAISRTLLSGATLDDTGTSLCKSEQIAYARHTMRDSSSDEQLMLQYKGGDASAFEVLYSRYRQPLFRYLQHQTGNAAIAEELFQDIWLNLIRARERYEVTASFKTFIYRMSHNRLIDYYRKNKHGIPTSYDEQDPLLNSEQKNNPVTPQRKVEGMQQLEQLMTAIDMLPEAQREAFLLKENTGLSVEEIAEITNTKPETAKSRIRYALKKIRETVDQD